MEKQSKKEWTTPTLEVLDIKNTMHGAGGSIVDKNRIDAKHPS
ncbi:hypothetical protein SAMN02799624_02517 [Paenibacillus sp. UNC496MF]|nr:paeninodin family lasso peptide [Paenibacillus sp. UNC496MF]SFI89000.1 hypothetical protein SAMN02799624_02517 [Paenibacillus sp. UNC496MF]